MSILNLTCNLEGEVGEFGGGFDTDFDSLYDGQVTFSVTDTTADDVNETTTYADYLNSVIGA